MHINAYLDIDVVAVETDDLVTVMLELTAPEADSAPRPPQAAVVVLDRSGSMAGPRLDAAKGSLLSLVTRLSDEDLLAVVTFDDQAEVVVAGAALKDSGRAALASAIGRIETGGCTDLSSGYLRGLQEARRISGDCGATIIVLSDGHANSGITDAGRFRSMAAAAARQGITTSSIGIGVGYDDLILSEMAIGGTGNHTFAEEADAAAAAVAGEIDGLLSKTVQAASLRLMPSDACTGLMILNDLPVNQQPGFILAELGDFYSGESRKLLIELQVPAMAGLGLAQVAELTFEYVSTDDLQAHSVTVPVSVNVVPADVARGRVPDAQVRQSALLLRVQDAKKDIETALRADDLATATSILTGVRDGLTGLDTTDPEVAEEMDFLNRAFEEFVARGAEYGRRTLSADRSKKARGLRRQQGGRSDRSLGHCPDCGGPLVPIVYGLPGSDLGDAAARGEIILGGCCITPGQPDEGCPACRA